MKFPLIIYRSKRFSPFKTSRTICVLFNLHVVNLYQLARTRLKILWLLIYNFSTSYSKSRAIQSSSYKILFLNHLNLPNGKFS